MKNLPTEKKVAIDYLDKILIINRRLNISYETLRKMESDEINILLEFAGYTEGKRKMSRLEATPPTYFNRHGVPSSWKNGK